MSTVKEIESAITQLEPGEVHAVADWLQEYREELWDKQMAADARAGKLDPLIQKAKADTRAGKVTPFP
jgi:cell division inhibitor SulA